MSPSATSPSLAVPWFRTPADPALERATLDAWRAVLAHGEFVGGPEIAAFERAFGARVGAACVGVASGTAALRLALQALGIGAGDEVLVPALTFVATAEAVVQTGARPVFVDVDPERATIDPEAAARAVGPRTRAIVAVHLYGRVADMRRLGELAAARGLRLVEDASQAHGARFEGCPVGALGDAAAFSFHPTKNLPACGDAGAVTSRDAALVERVAALRDHGQSVRQRHDAVGDTARLDALQAAALTLRLARLDEWNGARAGLARRYRERLAGNSGRLPELPSVLPEGEDVHHLFVVRHAERERLRERLAERGIGSGCHYPAAVPRQPAFRPWAPPDAAFPAADRWAARCLSLPLYPDLASADVDRVAATLADLLAGDAP